MFEYSKEIVVTSKDDPKVKKMLDEGWVMDKVTNNDEGWFFITFKRQIKK